MKYIITLLLTIVTSIPALSQAVTFTSAAPLSVEQGVLVRVEFTLVNAKAPKISRPVVTGADLLAGPTVYNGEFNLTLNGRTITTPTQTFTYVYVATKAGTVKVGALTVNANGKNYTSKPLTIEVYAKVGNSKNSGAQPFSSSDVLLRLELSKRTLYKGEPLVAQLKLYTRVDLLDVGDVKLPSFTNFWSEQLKTNIPPSRQTINNRPYNAYHMAQWLLFPQKSGQISIEPSSLTALLQVAVQNTANDYAEVLHGETQYRRINRSLKTPALTVNVLELPQPQPANFKGAIGDFSMTSEISTNTFSANSAGSIKLTVKGTGNLPLITVPKADIPAAFEVYDVKTESKLSNNSSGSSGTVTWEYPLIARAEGSYELPAIEFTYFNPKTKQYNTLSSGILPVTITKSETNTTQSGAFISGISKEDLQMLGQDIRFIKLGLKNTSPIGSTMMWSATFFGLVALIIALFFGAIFMLRKVIEQRGDITRTKNKKANKVALRRLKKAKNYMINSEPERFYDEMLKAMWGYVGDKLTIEISQLTKENVSARLQMKGVSPAKIDALMSLISACEEAQYAPSQAAPTDITYNEALEIIGNLERK